MSRAIELSDAVRSAAAAAGVVFGGFDRSSPGRCAEAAAFWRDSYGHEHPDGRGGWSLAPHRLLAYDAASGRLCGGVHFQNPKTASRNFDAKKGGYIIAIAV